MKERERESRGKRERRDISSRKCSWKYYKTTAQVSRKPYIRQLSLLGQYFFHAHPTTSDIP